MRHWFQKCGSCDFSLQNDALKPLVETNPTVSTRELATMEKLLLYLSDIGEVKKLISGYRPNEASEISWIN